MPQIHGQITTRLPSDSDRWTYHRDEEATDAVADEGYRLGTRWATVRRIQRRRRHAALMQAAVVSILTGLALVLAAGAEVYADHRYDGRSDWHPSWCWTSEAPDGFPQCREVQP